MAYWINSGWNDSTDDVKRGFVTRLSNCRHEISRWRENNPPYGKYIISELQRALEEAQTDDAMTQVEIIDVSRKLEEAYKDEKYYWQLKHKICGKRREIKHKILSCFNETTMQSTKQKF